MDKSVVKRKSTLFLKNHYELDIPKIFKDNAVHKVNEALSIVDTVRKESRDAFTPSVLYKSNPFIYFFFDFYKQEETRIRVADKRSIEQAYGSVKKLEYPYFEVNRYGADETIPVCSFEKNKFWFICDWLVTDVFVLLYFGPQLGSLPIPWTYVHEMKWYQTKKKRLFRPSETISGFSYGKSRYYRGVKYFGCQNKDFMFLKSLFSSELPEVYMAFDEALGRIYRDLESFAERKIEVVDTKETHLEKKKYQEEQPKEKKVKPKVFSPVQPKAKAKPKPKAKPRVRRIEVKKGTKVKLYEQSSRKTFYFTMSEYNNIDQGQLSVDSPLGKLLVGTKEGQKIYFNSYTYVVKKVSAC